MVVDRWGGGKGLTRGIDNGCGDDIIVRLIIKGVVAGVKWSVYINYKLLKYK